MQVVDRALTLARRWADESRQFPTPKSAQLLSQVLDAGGLDYTVGFVDGVIRPEDKKVAASNLARLSGDTSFLPGALGTLAKAGKLAPIAPGLATTAAREIFASLVGDLVLDVTPHKLGPAIEKLRKDGARLNLNLLGEAVLGDKEASSRLAAVSELVDRPDVDYVSLKVSAVLGSHSPYGYQEALEHAVHELRPLYEKAARNGTFINLDMEEYKDLHITIDVFKALLELDSLTNFRAGIVFQAYLPDARQELMNLTEWAKKRVAHGGAPIKVRLVKGANLSMERVDAVLHGWEQAVWPTKAHSDAAYLTMLDDALTEENTAAVKIGIAGQNLFTLAYGVALAEERGLSIGRDVEIEMLSGMATPQAMAITADLGPLLYYVPVVRPDEFDVAIAYLVRRLEENAAPENFMSNVFDLPTNQNVFDIESRRFLDAVELKDSLDFTPRRDVWEGPGRGAFDNAADTDPALPANIEWAHEIASRISTSTLGVDTVDKHLATTEEHISTALDTLRLGQQAWAAKSPEERAEVLRDVAQGLHANRARLIEVAASETGKAIDQGDVEVSEAIDFATYYAEQALSLDQPGMAFTPVPLTAVIPPWNFPIAIPTGGVLAALATGSAVAFKPAGLSARTGAVVAEIMWEAGVPRDVLQLITLDEARLDEDVNLGRYLVEHVDQVILTGSSETAQRFRDWRPDLRLFAETSGKNAIIVTPQADIDLAVADVAASAFGHAGQKCSAASLVILVGSVGYSKRFHDQLLDAVSSLHVSYPDDLACQVPPLIEPAGEKLYRGLTQLGEGETWALKPEQLDERLWRPGIRFGVQPGSDYHTTEFFGPVLGVMRAETLEEAIEWQNSTGFGLTAGLHSLDPDEIDYWLDRVEAGNVYLNRSITGAIVRRQPFGGWKKSAVGTGTKAGGPNYLLGLGTFTPTNTITTTEITDPILEHASLLVPEQIPYLAGLNSVLAEFRGQEDPSGLGVELNVFRYVPADNVVIRVGAGHEDAGIAAAAAALALDAEFSVSVAEGSQHLVDYLASYGMSLMQESSDQFAARVADLAHTDSGVRVRLLGEDPSHLATAVGGSIAVAIHAQSLSPAGRLEALPFVREQAISATNHRFGNPTRLLDGIL